MPSQRGGLFGFGENYAEANYATETGMNSGVLQYIYYFMIFTVITLLLLVLIHFFVTPIFKTRPGAKGIIALPGTDDSVLYWTNPQALKALTDTETPIGSTTENYSYLLDIQVDNPMANTNTPRILFYRGGPLNQISTYGPTDTILTLAPSFNTIVYLDRLTNDLNVAVQTVDNSSGSKQVLVENILIPNIPMRHAIRLGVMVGSRTLEVYVNGYLVRTKTYVRPLNAVVGPLNPPNDKILSGTARVRNLRLVGRPLSPEEFRSYGTAQTMELTALPDSCTA